MKKLRGICLSLFVLAGGANCSFKEYVPNEIYKYNTTVSEQSEAVNNSLKADVAKLLIQLKAENRQLTAQDRRTLANSFFIKHSSAVTVTGEIKNFTIKSEKDHYEIPVRLYNSENNSDRLIIFVHGGGWMQGNLDTHDYLCRKMTNILGCKVLAVDYRLAPEHKFPVGLKDVESVYKWCMGKTSKEIIGEVAQVYISGDSAGGNLSAALNLSLQRGEWQGHMPDGLLLFYPVLSNNVNSSSFKIFGNQAALTAVSTVAFAEQYIDAKINAPEIFGNELIFPILGNPEAYPKTLMIAAGCDVLLDGQIELFNKLNEKNIPVKLLIEDGAVHGFMTYGKEFDGNIDLLLQRIKDLL